MNEYEIAGIRLRLNHQYPDFFRNNIEAYRLPLGATVKYQIDVDVTSVFPVPQGRERIARLMRRVYESDLERTIVIDEKDDTTFVKQTITTSLDYKHTVIRINPNYGQRLPEIEYLATGMVFFDIAVAEGLLPIHAAAIEHQGSAILFAAPSGTGKSTHAALWRMYCDNVKIINDDKPLIGMDGEILTVFGTPWSGKDVKNENIYVPLKAIVFLKQSIENRSVELDREAALKHLFRNVYRPRDSHQTEKALEVMTDILLETDVVEFQTDVSEAAFRMIYARLYGGKKA